MTVRVIHPPQAAELLAGEDPPVLLDVRTPGELARASVDGAVAIPMNEIARRVGELDPDRPALLGQTGDLIAQAGNALFIDLLFGATGAGLGLKQLLPAVFPVARLDIATALSGCRFGTLDHDPILMRSRRHTRPLHGDAPCHGAPATRRRTEGGLAGTLAGMVA